MPAKKCPRQNSVFLEIRSRRIMRCYLSRLSMGTLYHKLPAKNSRPRPNLELLRIATRRRLRRMQAGRNFRSRAIGGPSRSRPGNGKCGKAFCFPLHTASVWLFRSDRKTRGIAACRCQWQMQAGRNFRSRAIGGPSRSRPGNGNAARRASVSPKRFPGTARRSVPHLLAVPWPLVILSKRSASKDLAPGASLVMAMRPPFFLFVLPKRKNAPRPV